MKPLLYVCLSAVLFTVRLSASAPFFDGFLQSTVELSAVVEKGFFNYFSAQFWIGGDLTAETVPGFFRDFAYGLKAGVEGRCYFFSNDKEGLFLSAYYQSAYMNVTEINPTGNYLFTFIQTYGGKVGYKFAPWIHYFHEMKFRTAIEPFVSFGNSVYYQGSTVNPDRYYNEQTLWLTVGVRLILELVVS
ncbi:MAG: hypothetical protein A2Y33_11365 [Spirochaetes bacterium GWF1_51_8]|nr:MAG: hypothetical protein A2Y33_11365 [Spirochaetes bacterium GWF1_51_8]